LTNRTAIVERATRETSIRAQLVVDGSGQAEVRTGIGFLDHLLESLVRHARFDLTLQTNGDLHVDDHHTAEDSALALGEALDRALRLGLRSARRIPGPGGRGSVGPRICRRVARSAPRIDRRALV